MMLAATMLAERTVALFVARAQWCSPCTQRLANGVG